MTKVSYFTKESPESSVYFASTYNSLFKGVPAERARYANNYCKGAANRYFSVSVVRCGDDITVELGNIVQQPRMVQALLSKGDSGFYQRSDLPETFGIHSKFGCNSILSQDGKSVLKTFRYR